MERTRDYVCCMGSNVFVSISGKVVSVKILKTYLSRELGCAELWCLGYLVEDGRGEKYRLSPETKFYISEEDFKRDTCIRHWFDFGCPRRVISQDGYYFEGGQAKRGHIKDLLEEFALNQDGSIEVIKGCMPTFYYTSEECYAYNDYRVCLEDGQEVLREGTHKSLLLNDEQKVILEEYKAIRQKMQDVNMLVIFDKGFWSTNVINATNVESIVDRGMSDEGVELFFSKEHEIPHMWDMFGYDGFGVKFK